MSLQEHHHDTENIESLVQNNIRNKRSISDDESNHDLEVLIDEKLDDSSEHWLARSVNRIKRSLGFSNNNQSNEEETKDLNNRKHKSKRKNETQTLRKHHHHHNQEEKSKKQKNRKHVKKNGKKREASRRVEYR